MRILYCSLSRSLSLFLTSASPDCPHQKLYSFQFSKIWHHSLYKSIYEYGSQTNLMLMYCNGVLVRFQFKMAINDQLYTLYIWRNHGTIRTNRKHHPKSKFLWCYTFSGCLLFLRTTTLDLPGSSVKQASS